MTAVSLHFAAIGTQATRWLRFSYAWAPLQVSSAHYRRPTGLSGGGRRKCAKPLNRWVESFTALELQPRGASIPPTSNHKYSTFSTGAVYGDPQAAGHSRYKKNIHGNQCPSTTHSTHFWGQKKGASGGMNPAELSRFPLSVRAIVEESV